MISPEWVQALFTAIAALGVLYVAVNQRRNAPHLKFDFESEDSLHDGRTRTVKLTRVGLIRNLSSKQDTISRVGVVAWIKGHKRHDLFSTRSDISVLDRDKKSYTPPFNLPGRTTVPITIKVKDLYLTDSLTDRAKAEGIHPAKKLEICFETTDGSWFTERGKFVDIVSASTISRRNEIGLAWWKPTNWVNKEFWYFDWELTKSRLLHRKRRMVRFLGL